MHFYVVVVIISNESILTISIIINVLVLDHIQVYFTQKPNRGGIELLNRSNYGLSVIQERVLRPDHIRTELDGNGPEQSLL